MPQRAQNAPVAITSQKFKEQSCRSEARPQAATRNLSLLTQFTAQYTLRNGPNFSSISTI